MQLCVTLQNRLELMQSCATRQVPLSMQEPPALQYLLPGQLPVRWVGAHGIASQTPVRQTSSASQAPVGCAAEQGAASHWPGATHASLNEQSPERLPTPQGRSASGTQ